MEASVPVRSRKREQRMSCLGRILCPDHEAGTGTVSSIEEIAGVYEHGRVYTYTLAVFREISEADELRAIVHGR